MKFLLLACMINLSIVPSVLAESHGVTPGRELSEKIFGSIEEHPNGLADMGEFVAFGNDIFESIDADDSASLTQEEFTAWDFGFNFIAKDAGQQRAYDTAQKIIFAFWDRDGDGKIGRSEYHRSMTADFQRADINDDAFLSEDEFLIGYIIPRAYRAALTGN